MFVKNTKAKLDMNVYERHITQQTSEDIDYSGLT